MLLELASRQQQDIVKTRIKWMKIADVLKGRAMPAVENNVMCTFWLITIRVIWKNDGDLIVGGIRQIVTVIVTGLIKVQSYLVLLVWRHIPGELIGLPVHLNCRMVMVKHVLEEGDQSGVMEMSVLNIGHLKVNGISWITDV